MIDFLKNFLDAVATYPERAAVVDKDGERSTSYKKLDELSGRVAAFLKNKGFQKEDLIAINLEKSMEYLAVELGVMKAGIAYVPLSESMGQERITHVLKDSGAKLVFDADTLEKAMEAEPLSPEAWADSDEHDLAFVIYTSGSTGKPKGVVEEYGAYRFTTKGTAEEVVEPYTMKDDAFRFANVAPVTFSAFTIINVSLLYNAGTIYIVSDAVVKNPLLYMQFLKDHRIDAMFLTASMIKPLSENRSLSPKAIMLSSERVSDVYSTKFAVLNLYCNTELMSTACNFVIDKPYSNTPIGRNCSYTDMILLDDGKVSEKEGEICLCLPYFRGYLNQKEETEKAFVSIGGKKFFCTRDVARRGEDGLLYVLGRADDMVKINGNRVEPAEVETVLKKVLETKMVAVKAFEKKGKYYLCAYYQKEYSIPVETIRASLKPLLPAYMIPSFFVQMKKIPLNTNGKIDRKNLLIPNFVSQNTYVAPRTECEKILCDAFKEALEDFEEIEKIGIDDDFFLMGGDSVSAMELMLACEEFKLTVPLIYEKRTVRALAEVLDKKISLSSPATAKETPEEKLPLILSQKEVLDYEACLPDTIVDNVPLYLTLRSDLDEKKLYQALKKVIEAHPALRTVIEKDREQGYVQYQKQNIDDAISVEAMSEKELDAIVENFGEIFPLDGSPLFRCRIIRTEKRLVLLLEVHHAIADGLSLHIFASDIEKAYRGEVLTKDCYNEFIKEIFAAEKDTSLLSLTANQNSTLTLSNGKICYCAPKHDFEKEDKAACQIITIPCTEKIRGFCFARAISQNDFYLFATALSLALYNDCEQVAFDWIWNGRDSAKYADTIGYFLKEYFIALELPQSTPVLDALITCKNKILQSLSSANDMSQKRVLPDENKICFIFQGEMYVPNTHGFVTSAKWIENSDRAAESIMDIEVKVDDGKTEVSFDYDGGKYKSESIATFSKVFVFCCQMILKVDENAGLTIGELKKQWQKI